MCLALPAKVIELNNHVAIVNLGGTKLTVNTALIKDLNINDYVIVHCGCAIEKIQQTDIDDTLNTFKEVFPNMEW